MADEPHVIDVSQRSAARVAALAYLIPVAFVVYATFGMRGRLLVAGDMAETVRRIAAAGPLFRLSVAFDLVYCIGVVVLLSALYVVLAPVNRHLALLATLLKLVYAVTAVLMALSLLTVGRLASDAAYLQALKAEPLQALVRMNLAAPGEQYYVGLAFWALSSTVLGWLWLKSHYIPAALAGFGLVSSAWCVFCTFGYIINPAFSRAVNLWWFDTPMALFDSTLSLWLLFKGLRAPAALAAAKGRQ
jgi:hypothetical protein